MELKINENKIFVANIGIDFSERIDLRYKIQLLWRYYHFNRMLDDFQCYPNSERNSNSITIA